MPHNAHTLLEDIRRSAQLIESFAQGKSLADYGSEIMLHAAIERQFIIIGEALSRLEKLDRALTSKIANYRQIIGFRNVLVHGYDAIDDPVVWQVIQSDLGTLKKQVEDLLAATGPP